MALHSTSKTSLQDLALLMYQSKYIEQYGFNLLMYLLRVYESCQPILLNQSNLVNQSILLNQSNLLNQPNSLKYGDIGYGIVGVDILKAASDLQTSYAKLIKYIGSKSGQEKYSSYKIKESLLRNCETNYSPLNKIPLVTYMGYNRPSKKYKYEQSDISDTHNSINAKNYQTMEGGYVANGRKGVFDISNFLEFYKWLKTDHNEEEVDAGESFLSFIANKDPKMPRQHSANFDLKQFYREIKDAYGDCPLDLPFPLQLQYHSQHLVESYKEAFADWEAMFHANGVQFLIDYRVPNISPIQLTPDGESKLDPKTYYRDRYKIRFRQKQLFNISFIDKQVKSKLHLSNEMKACFKKARSLRRDNFLELLKKGAPWVVAQSYEISMEDMENWKDAPKQLLEKFLKAIQTGEQRIIFGKDMKEFWEFFFKSDFADQIFPDIIDFWYDWTDFSSGTGNLVFNLSLSESGLRQIVTSSYDQGVFPQFDEKMVMLYMKLKSMNDQGKFEDWSMNEVMNGKFDESDSDSSIF